MRSVSDDTGHRCRMAKYRYRQIRRSVMNRRHRIEQMCCGFKSAVICRSGFCKISITMTEGQYNSFLQQIVDHFFILKFSCYCHHFYCPISIIQQAFHFFKGSLIDIFLHMRPFTFRINIGAFKM
ncbi:hypothetical protein D3C85_1219860 [compost metagenome]